MFLAVSECAKLILCLRKRCIHLSSCHVQITTFLLAYFGLLGQGPSNIVNQINYTMVNRLPAYILNELICRIELNESPIKIERQLYITRRTIYKIRDNLNLYSVPYPPNTIVKIGRLRLLIRTIINIRNTLPNSIIYIS
jgi:hypothetical protein